MKKMFVVALLCLSTLTFGQKPQPKKVHRHDPPVFSTTVTLTASDVDNLSYSPVLLVPAAGTGTMIIPQMFIFEYHYSVQAFDISLQPSIEFMWDSSLACPQGGMQQNIDGGFMTVPLDTVSFATPAMSPAAVAVTNSGHVSGWCSGIDNKGLYLLTQYGDFQNGGSSTLKVTTLYYIIND